MKTSFYLNFVFSALFLQQVAAQSPMMNLEKYTGNWKAVVTMWMMPGDPPMIDSLTVLNEMMMNDLFFTMKYSGEMMGMNYEGQQAIGYDVVKKKFVSSFMDNMNSGIDYKEGIMNENGKSMELLGTAIDANSGKNISTRELISFVNNSEMKIACFEGASSDERKTLEYILTRK